MASETKCENCSSASAAWFCTADGAYLCSRCDILIHSANKLAMRHERIPIEAQMAKDALKCHPCPPAYDNALMGMSQRTGAEQVIEDAPSTSAMKPGGGDGSVNGGEMDWLVMGGGLDDPLTSLLNMEQENQANGGGGFTLSDDLFSMPAANPSGLFAGVSNASQQLGPTAASPEEGMGSRGAGFSMQLGSIGEHQVKQESAASGASDTTHAHMAPSRGDAMVGGQQQQQQQRVMGALGDGPQEEVEAVLTRPFAASALRHAQLQRYRAKRLARHLGHKKIRYECRKTLADNRPRIKGRFAKVLPGGDGDDCNDGGNSVVLTTAMSCPDLTALARLDRELEGSEDSSNKKSRLGKASAAVNSTTAGSIDGAAADDNVINSKKSAGGKASSSAAGGNGRGNGERGINFLRGGAGEQMADNALMGEIGDWGKGSGDGGEGKFSYKGGGGGGSGHLRGGGRLGMPYSQSEMSLVALERVVW